MKVSPLSSCSISEQNQYASTFINAAGCGDSDTVTKMLQNGFHPDLRNAKGKTALHLAVGRGHAQTAACLLAYSADHTMMDASGRPALGPAHTTQETLHAIRQRYHRFRTIQTSSGTVSQEAASWAADLERHGIIKLPGFIETETLNRLQSDFKQFLSTITAKINRGEGIFRYYDEEEHWWKNDNAFVTNNAFKYSSQLARLCCRDKLLETVRLYIGKDVSIQRALGMSYLPGESTTNDMFGWHHDMEDRRLKMFILLTDVSEQDQYMSYISGSHHIYHPLAMFYRNESSLEYCRNHLGELEIFKTVGKAGDVFLFDSNGTHRGNRRPDAAIRNVFLVEFTADKSDIWGGDIDSETINAIALEGQHPFDHFMRVEKKWNQIHTRVHPTWVENLPYIEKWL